MGQHAMDVAWNLYNSFGVYLIFVFIGISYLTLFKRMSLLERIVYTYLGFYVFSNAVLVRTMWRKQESCKADVTGKLLRIQRCHPFPQPTPKLHSRMQNFG